MNHMHEAKSGIDPTHFRRVLGEYPTGVVVVTATSSSGEPIGMTVGSFTSVSLEPPLVAFLPSKASSSWKALRESGTSFCINVLSAAQEDLCRTVATRKADKFSDVLWHLSAAGNPVIDGAVLWVDCVTEQIHDAGDHDIVIGRVLDLDRGATGLPLMFFRGGYGSFTPLSLAAGDTDLLSHLRLIDLARPSMEALAASLNTEVTAIALVGDELVLAAAVGRTEIAVAPTRVGQRLPFMPPIGSCFAAWGDQSLRDKWIAPVEKLLSEQQIEELRRVPDLVRERGYAVAAGHREGAHLESVATRINAGDPDVSLSALREAFLCAAHGYNQTVESEADVELRSLSAPVFSADGRVAYMLTLWGRPGPMSPAEVRQQAGALLETASTATDAICSDAKL